jgi:hypothetical protein
MIVRKIVVGSLVSMAAMSVMVAYSGSFKGKRFLFPATPALIAPLESPDSNKEEKALKYPIKAPTGDHVSDPPNNPFLPSQIHRI